jgi:hypothetical protein
VINGFVFVFQGSGADMSPLFFAVTFVFLLIVGRTKSQKKLNQYCSKKGIKSIVYLLYMDIIGYAPVIGYVFIPKMVGFIFLSVPICFLCSVIVLFLCSLVNCISSMN